MYEAGSRQVSAVPVPQAAVAQIRPETSTARAVTDTAVMTALPSWTHTAMTPAARRTFVEPSNSRTAVRSRRATLRDLDVRFSCAASALYGR
ncbi:hypothetical protein GCM10018780_79820 [Streptomyces lanatus]|nr:hypothetical protein GCM10018780_79820 [Streptomyces lanatus]